MEEIIKISDCEKNETFKEKFYNLKYDILQTKMNDNVSRLLKEVESNECIKCKFKFNPSTQDKSSYYKAVDSFLKFNIDEKLIGNYHFYTDVGISNPRWNYLFYTNYGNVLYFYSHNEEEWNITMHKAFVEKLNFKIPPFFINLLNTVILNYESSHPENTELGRIGKINGSKMTFNTLVNFLRQVKNIL